MVAKSVQLGSVLTFLLVAGCSTNTDPPPANAQQPTKPVQLTLLYTADEHGWITPFQNGADERGGASNLYAQLMAQEAHCVSTWSDQPSPLTSGRCATANTLLLSGGDNYTGPVISTFFGGHSMAQVMRHMGYVASAFGNHEFDFGQDRFIKNRAASGMHYLAANMVGATPNNGFTQPSIIVERQGIRLGIVGLATPETLKTAAPHRFHGLRFLDIEPTLAKEVPALWRKNVDGVIVIAHECASVLEPVIQRHPEWALSFVGGGHCHKKGIVYAHKTPVINPDWRMQHYGRVVVEFDRSKPARRRATVMAASLERVTPAKSKGTDVRVPWEETQLPQWRAEIHQALGEVIGFSEKGLDKKSSAIGRWIVGAWQAELKVDAALTTRGAIRQSLPTGPITLGTIRSIMPFENDLFVCKLPGSILLKFRARKNAVFVGPEVIDPKRMYRLATTDFLYNGGDGYPIHVHDPKPIHTHQSWRAPVIAWTRRAASRPGQPLERKVKAGEAEKKPAGEAAK